MMDEKDYELSFKIILHAGDAKSKAMEAISAANVYDFIKSEELINEAQKELRSAHQIQTSLITEETNGNGAKVSVLLIHSQDHFSMALTAIENAKQVLITMKKIQRLEDLLMNKEDEND